MTAVSEWQVVGEVALAALLGGLIGLEREAAHKPAGFRTNMIVAAAAALLVGIGDALVDNFERGRAADGLQADPIRIVEAIVTGISFLGAGTIIRRTHREGVEGLTTAASLLLCAAIGISVAVGQFIIAVGVTLLALFILRVLGWIDSVVRRKRAAKKFGEDG